MSPVELQTRPQETVSTQGYTAAEIRDLVAIAEHPVDPASEATDSLRSLPSTETTVASGMDTGPLDPSSPELTDGTTSMPSGETEAWLFDPRPPDSGVNHVENAIGSLSEAVLDYANTTTQEAAAQGNSNVDSGLTRKEKLLRQYDSSVDDFVEQLEQPQNESFHATLTATLLEMQHDTPPEALQAKIKETNAVSELLERWGQGEFGRAFQDKHGNWYFNASPKIELAPIEQWRKATIALTSSRTERKLAPRKYLVPTFTMEPIVDKNKHPIPYSPDHEVTVLPPLFMGHIDNAQLAATPEQTLVNMIKNARRYGAALQGTESYLAAERIERERRSQVKVRQTMLARGAS